MNKAEAKRMAHRVVGDQIREWLERDWADLDDKLSDADNQRLEAALVELMDAHYARGQEVPRG